MTYHHLSYDTHCHTSYIVGFAFSKPTPGGVAGYDVNDGCKLCYTGEDVTAENLLAVLKGDGKTTGAPTPCAKGWESLLLLSRGTPVMHAAVSSS